MLCGSVFSSYSGREKVSKKKREVGLVHGPLTRFFKEMIIIIYNGITVAVSNGFWRFKKHP